jgi:hypothetical protein
MRKNDSLSKSSTVKEDTEATLALKEKDRDPCATPQAQEASRLKADDDACDDGVN